MADRTTSGKQRGLEGLCDSRGVIAALAIDQRSALRKLFSMASGRTPEDIPTEWLIEFKEKVSKILTPHASAILLDPEYGLRAAGVRAPKAGLILAYEKSGYHKKVPGRLPQTLAGQTAGGLKAKGADAVKVLLYYSPFSPREINTLKQSWVKRIGEECGAADVAFLLEIVSYHDEMDEKSAEFARIKPEVVARSVEEFCKPEYSVDVLKVGVPVNIKFVESQLEARSQAIYSRTEAIAHFRRAAEAATRPFIYLSEGVSNELFVAALQLAGEAKADYSGVLCGRATWQDGVPVFVQRGGSALEDWLGTEGVRNIETVNAQLLSARPLRERLASVTSGKG